MSLLSGLTGSEAGVAGLGKRVTGSLVRAQIGVTPANENTILTAANSVDVDETGVTMTAYTKGFRSITTMAGLTAASWTNVKAGSHLRLKHTNGTDKVNDGEAFYADVVKKTVASANATFELQNLVDIYGVRLESFGAVTGGAFTICAANFKLVPLLKTAVLNFEETRGTIDEKQDQPDVVALNRTFAQRRGWTMEITRNISDEPDELDDNLVHHVIETKDEPIEFRMIIDSENKGWVGAGVLQPSAFPGGGSNDDIAESGFTINAASYLLYSARFNPSA